MAAPYALARLVRTSVVNLNKALSFLGGKKGIRIMVVALGVMGNQGVASIC